MVWMRIIVAVAFVGISPAVSTGLAADANSGWPPSLDRGNTYTQSLDGRTIERFTHQSLDKWGYKDSRHNCFFLVHPKKLHEGAPLFVVLHSANRTALDFLGYMFLNRKVDPNDNPSDFGEKAPADFFTLFLDSNNNEAWGSSAIYSNRDKYAKEPTPTESRVLDTIDWVATKYKVDRNRIYLTGCSMGGGGGLAIGLAHGDVFAAVRLWVPAGTYCAACRRGFAARPTGEASTAEKNAWVRKVSGAGLPDPPVVVDLSATNDGCSSDQGVLLTAAREGRLPLVVGWGPFGHTGAHSPVAKYPYCSATLALPWMEIRKNEACPVFTHASSDQRAPWLNQPGESDASGQINAFFRWKSVTDTSSAFAMRVWLEGAAPGASPSNAPKQSVADITFRRLQRFQVVAGKSYTWELVRKGKSLATGAISPDPAGLLTIPKATITVAPVELRVRPR